MQAVRDEQATCARVVASLNGEHGWHLTSAQQAAYVAAVAKLAKAADETKLKRLVNNYHQDHELVEALQNQSDPGHQAAWEQLRAIILAMLRSASLDHNPYSSLDLEDLAQVALDELLRSLGSYRFESRFTTWAYMVALRRGRRMLRDLGAPKRSSATIPLERAVSIAGSPASAANPETVAAGKELAALIAKALAEMGDERLAAIFRLWVEQDLRLADIGKQVGLGTARVSTLLEQARQILRAHPNIQEWIQGRSESTND